MSDAYTGDVRVGGPADVREVPGARITKLAVGPFDNNVYLIRCARSGHTLLVDAAAEPERILAALGDDPLVGIVETHGHGDHVQALEAVRAATGARIACHQLDEPMMPVPVDDRLDDGDVVVVGHCRLKTIHLAGHTPGGLALLYDAGGVQEDCPHLFSGDSLFPGGPGNTGHDPDRFARLMDDLNRKVFGVLPDQTWVYPGHGKDTTLGAERPHIPEWLARGW